MSAWICAGEIGTPAGSPRGSRRARARATPPRSTSAAWFQFGVLRGRPRTAWPRRPRLAGQLAGLAPVTKTRTCATAWCSSIRARCTRCRRPPASSARSGARPRVVGDVEQHRLGRDRLRIRHVDGVRPAGSRSRRSGRSSSDPSSRSADRELDAEASRQGPASGLLGIPCRDQRARRARAGRRPRAPRPRSPRPEHLHVVERRSRRRPRTRRRCPRRRC
jgi:hypothetical protein